MNNQQIKEYIYSLGETAAKLHDVELSLYRIADDDDAKLREDISALVDLVDKHADAQSIIAQLGHDSRTEIREIAAALINYLWKYWKCIPYHEYKIIAWQRALPAETVVHNLRLWAARACPLPPDKPALLNSRSRTLLINPCVSWQTSRLMAVIAFYGPNGRHQ